MKYYNDIYKKTYLKKKMENIDKIFYINLFSRKDRDEKIIAEFEKLGIEKEKYCRFEAIPTPGFGILGCGLSHLSVIQTARQRGYRNVLILEDDVQFVRNREYIDEILNRIFQIDKVEFDVLFFSYIIYNGQNTEYDYLKRGLHTTTATAYLVNSHYYDKIIELYEFSTEMLFRTRKHWIYANDVVWKQLQSTDRWYCIFPILAIQQRGYSDNSQSYQDYTNNYEKYY